jgi:chromate transport protein ChrA
MFQTVARAELKPEADGTAIVLTAGMDRIVFVFGCIILGAFLVISVLFLLAYIRVFQSFQFSDEDRKDWLFLSLPVVSAIVFVALAQLGRYAARDEAPFLIRLLVDAMEAKPKGRPASQQRPPTN